MNSTTSSSDTPLSWHACDQDPMLRKKLFPVTDARPYFGHAGVAPIGGCAATALRTYTEHACTDDQETGWIWQQVPRTRRAIADLLGTTADTVSFIGPTAAGLGTVALGFPWQPGDAVLFHADDYPANVYPWRDLERQGVTTLAIQPEQPGVIDWPLIEQALTPAVRLVSLASCHYLSGYCPDLHEIGSHLQARGIKLCVDGIQTLGVRPLPLDTIDFLAADGHKWLLAPCGAGLFWANPKSAELLHPPFVGAWNIRSPEFLAQEQMEFENGGQRFECGTLNLPGALALGASCKTLHDLDVKETQQRIAAVHQQLREGLEPLGFTPVLDDKICPPENRGPMLSLVHHDNTKPQKAAAALRERGIAVSQRQLRDGRNVLRLAPHGYTSQDDTTAVIETLQEKIN